jgi:hypothetical protein
MGSFFSGKLVAWMFSKIFKRKFGCMNVLTSDKMLKHKAGWPGSFFMNIKHSAVNLFMGRFFGRLKWVFIDNDSCVDRHPERFLNGKPSV